MKSEPQKEILSNNGQGSGLQRKNSSWTQLKNLKRAYSIFDKKKVGALQNVEK